MNVCKSSLLGQSILCLALLATLTGCRLGAPVYVWSSPRVLEAPNKVIAIGPITSNGETGERLTEALAEQRPLWQQEVAVYMPDSLEIGNEVRTVSTAPPLALQGEAGALFVARRAGAQLLITGQVMRDELRIDDGYKNGGSPNLIQSQSRRWEMGPLNMRRPERLTVAWKFTDVSSGEKVGEATISIDRHGVDETYPEMLWKYPEPDKRVIHASGREMWKAIAPYVEKMETTTAATWVLPGSSQIRNGCLLAAKGKWPAAEVQWREVVNRFPWQHAAWHNLALAAVAREDFAEAKRCIRKALSYRSKAMYESTLIWIDQRQKAHHAAFQLPPPEEGWVLPGPAPFVPLPDVKPIDIDQLPWWTAIPLTKPPGWTWYDWIRQPIVY